MDVSVGVITYNDPSLPTLVGQILSSGAEPYAVKEVIVVSSGILPANREPMGGICGSNPQVRLVEEDVRCGKAAAVNAFLGLATGELCVLVSGDVLLEGPSLDELLRPFSDPKVGMVGGRTLPMNDDSTFMGFAVNLVWRVHHELCLLRPKVGELVAFRRLFREISPKTAVDEAWIESVVAGSGYGIRYAPAALARNMGPTTLADYVLQRRRIHIGHVDLKRERGYSVSSLRYRDVFTAFLSSLPFRPKQLAYAAVIAFLEVYIRVSADIDYFGFGRNPYCWDIAESAKIRRSAKD
jgi:poly-beta-1,6-N-acetyl-D-glucosamine synthase